MTQGTPDASRGFPTPSCSSRIDNFFTKHETTLKVTAFVFAILILLSICLIINGTGVLLKRLANIDIFNQSAYGNAYRNMSVLGGSLLLGGGVLGVALFSTGFHFAKKKLFPNGMCASC